MSRRFKKLLQYKGQENKGFPFKTKEGSYRQKENEASNDVFCYKCNKPSHIRSTCPRLKKSEKKRD